MASPAKAPPSTAVAVKRVDAAVLAYKYSLGLPPVLPAVAGSKELHDTLPVLAARYRLSLHTAKEARLSAGLHSLIAHTLTFPFVNPCLQLLQHQTSKEPFPA